MHLIFDLDGTLIDSRHGIQAALEIAVRNVYPHLDIGQLHIAIGPQIRDILPMAIKQASASEIAVMESAFRTAYDSEGWKKAFVYPGVEETLKKLLKRGYALYIFTNKPKLPTYNILKHLDLFHYFRDVLSSDSHQPQFNNKASMLNHLMHKYAIPYNDVVCIGDSEDDLRAAQASNVDFIGIEYGYGTLPLRENLSKSLRSFPEILSAL